MWHKFVLTVRFLWYPVLGCLVCLVLTFIFNYLSLFPQKFYHFQWYHLYLGGTLLCLPFFRLRHPQLFSTDDDFVSYRQKHLIIIIKIKQATIAVAVGQLVMSTLTRLNILLTTHNPMILPSVFHIVLRKVFS